MTTTSFPSVVWTSQLLACISGPSHSAGLAPNPSSETSCINSLSICLLEPGNLQEDTESGLLPGSIQGSVLGSWPALG